MQRDGIGHSAVRQVAGVGALGFGEELVIPDRPRQPGGFPERPALGLSIVELEVPSGQVDQHRAVQGRDAREAPVDEATCALEHLTHAHRRPAGTGLREHERLQLGRRLGALGRVSCEVPLLARDDELARRHPRGRRQRDEHGAGSRNGRAVSANELPQPVAEGVRTSAHGLVAQVPVDVVGEGGDAGVAFAGLLAQGLPENGVEIAGQLMSESRRSRRPESGEALRAPGVRGSVTARDYRLAGAPRLAGDDGPESGGRRRLVAGGGVPAGEQEEEQDT